MDDSAHTQNVNIEYRNNKQIHIIHINGSRRDDVDAYVNAIVSEIIEKPDNLLLSVHNYSKLGGMLSPYFLGRIKEFTKPEYQRTDFMGRVALVHSADMFRILFNPIVSIFTRTGSSTLDIKFFSDLDDAVAWVEAYEIPSNLS